MASLSEAVLAWRLKFMKALKERNETEILILLQTCPEDLSVMLNTPLLSQKIIADGVYEICETDTRESRFTLPIVIAAVHGNADIVETLYNEGADIYRIDAEGENIVHAMCWASAFLPERETNLCKVYDRIIRLVETKENRVRLLHCEDSLGFRPFELAAKLCTFGLMRKIVETEHVYKTVIRETPIGRKVQYDLSEYEVFGTEGARRKLNPLDFIGRLMYADLKRESVVEIFHHPLFKQWISQKFRDSKLFVVLIFVTNTLMTLGITTFDEFGHSDVSCSRNVTIESIHFNIPNTVKSMSFYITTIFAFVCEIGMTTVIRIVYRKAHSKHGLSALQRPEIVRPPGGRAINYTQFWAMYMFRSLSLIIYFFLVLFVPDWSRGAFGEVMLLLRVTIQISLWWTMSYIVQLVPEIGHLVIGAFRCLDTFNYFVFVFLIFFIASAEGMRSVAQYYCITKLGFSLDSYYSTFLIMLNMISTKSLDINLHATPVALVYMHTHIVFILTVLLVNFLIALLSKEVQKIEQFKHIIMMLIKLNVSTELVWFYESIHNVLPKWLRINRESYTIECDEYSV